jgi:large subunit ribosomal protein L20
MVRSRAGAHVRVIKRARVLALTKGFRGRTKNCYSLAIRAAHRAWQFAYKGRKLKKRDMRKLWIQRINYGVSEHGLPYSRFISGLVRLNIQLNRKVLSELAIHEPRTFQSLAELVKKRHSEGLTAVFDSGGARIVKMPRIKGESIKVQSQENHHFNTGKQQKRGRQIVETAV